MLLIGPERFHGNELEKQLGVTNCSILKLNDIKNKEKKGETTERSHMAGNRGSGQDEPLAHTNSRYTLASTKASSSSICDDKNDDSDNDDDDDGDQDKDNGDSFDD